jgi:SAM-dependent methyltransferase
MIKERIRFGRTGGYSSATFDEVAQRVYLNPETMRYHMHGLVFAQFLWPEQYHRYAFFCKNLPLYRGPVRRYLEIGGGHALYLLESLRVLGEGVDFDLVDISPSSMELAKGMVGESPVRYLLGNVLEWRAETEYDFVTVGEVIEHLERPLELIEKVRSLLTPHGRAYITTPANSPTIDHIYLFRDEDEIRAMLHAGGFEIERETMMYGEDLPPEQARAKRSALMYAAFLKKR